MACQRLEGREGLAARELMELARCPRVGVKLNDCGSVRTVLLCCV